MTTTQTDKNFMQMEQYHDELKRELAKQSKLVHHEAQSTQNAHDISYIFNGFFGTSKSGSQSFSRKSSSSK